MTRPLLLDLFCGAGGAAVGYHRAGFDVVGVDINPQPHYPFEFYQADALAYLSSHGALYDAIHASPPCQSYSAMSNCRPGLSGQYPELVGAVRELLQRSGSPWMIENVVGSPLLLQPSLYDDLNGITLCGLMFGLKLYRHRLFESNIPLTEPHHPKHLQPGGSAGHWRPGTIISVSGNCSPISLAREAMGIDWMSRDELAEAIPPAYTQFVGKQLLAAVEAGPGEWRKWRGLRLRVKNPPLDVMTCRCGHLVAVHTPNCERCLCRKALHDTATYPIGQTVVTT